MRLNEAHGVITDPKKSTDKLVELIVDYIYDVEDGLNSYINLDPHTEPIITLSILKSYWKYKHNNVFKQDIIPEWIGNFKIKIEEYKNQVYAALYTGKSTLNKETNKLDFDIIITDNSSKSTTRFAKELSHEFRHAYTDYIKKTVNNPNLYKKDMDLYKLGTQYARKYSIVSHWDIDYIDVNEKIFTDKEYIQTAIFKSLYYLDASEIQSYLQEFAMALKLKIQDYAEDIEKALKQSRELKKNYKNLNNADKWMSNIQNNVPVSCYQINIYRTYKALYIFWSSIDKIDPSLLDEVILENVEVFKKIFKVNDIHINVLGDGMKYLKKVSFRYVKILAKMLKKMHDIYYDMIDITTENVENIDKNIDKISIDNIIDIDDFEESLMGLMSKLKNK